MTKENAKKWEKEITHFINGGDLWWYMNKIWHKYEGDIRFTENSKVSYIIEDEYFEARKGFALGEEVEYRSIDSNPWTSVCAPHWHEEGEYRVKQEPTYYYKYETLMNGRIEETQAYLTDDEASVYILDGWRRIESSKRTWDE